MSDGSASRTARSQRSASRPPPLLQFEVGQCHEQGGVPRQVNGRRLHQPAGLLHATLEEPAHPQPRQDVGVVRHLLVQPFEVRNRFRGLLVLDEHFGHPEADRDQVGGQLQGAVVVRGRGLVVAESLQHPAPPVVRLGVVRPQVEAAGQAGPRHLIPGTRPRPAVVPGTCCVAASHSRHWARYAWSTRRTFTPSPCPRSWSGPARRSGRRPTSGRSRPRSGLLT